jgi:hypothetical protein
MQLFLVRNPLYTQEARSKTRHFCAKEEIMDKQGSSMTSQLPVPVPPAGTPDLKPNGGASPHGIVRTFRPIVSNHVKDWDRMLCTLNRGHWDAARNYDGWDNWLGWTSAATGLVAGSAAFTQISEYAAQGTGKVWVQILVGAFALIASVLGALKSKSGLSSMANMHKSAGQKFGMLRREFDEMQEIGFASMDEERAGLKAFREKWDSIEADVPPVPKRSMDKAKREAAVSADGSSLTGHSGPANLAVRITKRT